MSASQVSLMLGAAVFVLGSGCQQNPLKGAPPLVEQKPPGVVSNPNPSKGADPSPPPKKEEPKPKQYYSPYGLKVPEVMEFIEGQLGEFFIEYWLPAPAKGTITINGLPAGAEYHPDQMKISWTPPYDAANDSENLSVSMRLYRIEVQLVSDQEPLLEPLKRSAVIVVKDAPQKYEFENTKNRYKLTPGRLFVQNLKIRSEDFPDGPFFLKVEGLPVGAYVQTFPKYNEFNLCWTPGENDGDQKVYKLNMSVTNLRGQRIELRGVEWVVH